MDQTLQTLEERQAFKEKLRSIQWGVSTQSPGALKNYYDSELVDEVFGGDEGRDEYLEAVEGIPLKWENDVPYYKDKVGDYVAADEKVMNRVMYGGRPPEEASRSFGFGSGSESSNSSGASGG
jgi:hypothetical protein